MPSVADVLDQDFQIEDDVLGKVLHRRGTKKQRFRTWFKTTGTVSKARAKADLARRKDLKGVEYETRRPCEREEMALYANDETVTLFKSSLSQRQRRHRRRINWDFYDVWCGCGCEWCGYC